MISSPPLTRRYTALNARAAIRSHLPISAVSRRDVLTDVNASDPRRVLQSLLTAELASASIRRRPMLLPALKQPWPDSLLLDDSEDADAALGCDSLDRLRLAAAVNERFHLNEANQKGGLLADFTFGAWLDRIQAIWRDGVSNLTFVTSGLTGQPKRCRHEFRPIEAEIAFLADHWRDRHRIVAMVPAHRIYGFLFTAVLLDVLEIPCFDAFDMGPGAPSQALRCGTSW